MEKLISLILDRLNNLIMAMACIRNAYARKAIEVLSSVQVLNKRPFSLGYSHRLHSLDEARDQILSVFPEYVFTASQDPTFQSTIEHHQTL
jgi:hypothetical protein